MKHRYIFNSRDIASYFKWFSVPSHLEVSYMKHIFDIGAPVLARPLIADFEFFKKSIYKELYYLWANGFENERSDISNMVNEGELSLICDQECINLESYMKLIALHLIFTKNLPYVNINFMGLPFQLGIRCSFDIYEKNVGIILDGLNLQTTDKFGKNFDIKNLGVPDELLRVSLSSDFRKEVLGSSDIRETLRQEQKDRMSEYISSSEAMFGSVGNRISRKKDNDLKVKDNKNLPKPNNNIKISTSNQPKGIPLKDNRHVDKD